MHIRYGYQIELVCERDTPIVTMLDVHPSRRHDLVAPDDLHVTALSSPERRVPMNLFLDHYGNLCRRFVAPAGGVLIEASGIAHDDGHPDAVERGAVETRPEHLPDDVMMYLLGSRYCETDKLSNMAWSLFGGLQPGWDRVQAIVDFVHNHITFNYAFANATRTATGAFEEKIGVCRDFAHLAVALCRCLNIPARYCNGYLGDIGVPKDPAPMDFSAWFEVWLGGRWYTFDARHNKPCIGRIVIARGRDATDVAMVNSFGQHWLKRFEVVTEEVESHMPRSRVPVRLAPLERARAMAAEHAAA